MITVATNLTEELKLEKEALRRLFFYESPFVMNMWNDDYTLHSPNKRSVEIFGLNTQEEFLANFDKLSPEYQPCGTLSSELALRYVKQAFECGKANFEWMHQTIKQEPLPVEIILLRFEDAGKAFVLAYAIDLREIKYAEQQRLEIEQELAMFSHMQLIFDSAPMGVCVYDNDSHLIDCNLVVTKMFGYDDKIEFMKNFSSDFFRFSPNMQPCGSDTKALYSEKWVHFAKEGAGTFEWMHVDLYGDNLPVEISWVRVNHRDSYLLVAYVSDLRKIKEVKRLEQQAMEKMKIASEMVEALLDASPLFIEIWSEDFELIDCNNRFMSLYNINCKEKFKEIYYTLSPERQPCGVDSITKTKMLLKEALKNGRAECEWMHQTLEDEELPVRVLFKRVPLTDGTSVIVGYNVDLREINKTMEEKNHVTAMAEANKAKSKFLAEMSHEIRTPISAVIGIAEIQLQSLDLDPSVEAAFVRIMNSSTLLLGLVNDILDLSKMESGKMNILQEKYSVANLISNVSYVHFAVLGDKEIEFVLNIDEEIPVYLKGDRLRVEQILINLLSNAFKYTEQGTVSLSFKCKPWFPLAMLETFGIKEEDDYVASLLIEVKDTGIGMSKEQVSSIHNDYARFAEKKYSSISGTGLGMSIVYNLLDQMGAYIEIDSELGVGTTVKVTIPQKIVSADILDDVAINNLCNFELEQSPQKAQKFQPEPMPYGRVLVVDDIDANLFVAQGLLDFYDLNVETATSGVEALERIKNGETFDLILMDHMMPELNGVDATIAIRELGYNLPIVMLTANLLTKAMEGHVEEHFNGFLSKPIDTKRLHTTLVKHIKDKQSKETLDKVVPKKEKKNIENFQNDDALIEKLKQDFAKKQKNTMTEIVTALNNSDFYTANLKSHTIKGLAALIGEKTLSKVAADIEKLAQKEQMPTEEQLRLMEEEMVRVLGSIEVVASDNGEKSKDKEKALELLAKIQPLLEQRKAEAGEYVDELRTFAETAVLAKQIEKFEFKPALSSLNALIEILTF